MKLNAWEDYKNRFGELPNKAIQAELDKKLATLNTPNPWAGSEDDL